jgi:hypothetical protein
VSWACKFEFLLQPTYVMARCCRIELLPINNDEMILFNVRWDKSPTAVLLLKKTSYGSS